jgi:hypothetical protein
VNNCPAWLIYARARLNPTAWRREESGAALPIVLALLVLGSLIIVPFVTHAGDSLFNSRVYAAMGQEQYAADAGVEQAIWDLKYGTMVSRLNSAGGTLSYTLGNQVNGIAPVMTVTQSGSGGGGGTAGTITPLLSGSYKFDVNGYNPVITNVSGDIYAVAYRNSSNNLILKTLNITGAGAITQSALGTLTIASTGYEPDILKIASGIVAVVYRGSSNKGYIATVQINSDGTIAGTPTAATAFNTFSGNYEPSFINISGNYYALAFRGPSYKGYVQTLQINTSGVVTNFQVSSYNFVSTCYEPSMIRSSGTYYGVAYRGASNLGYLTTLNIDNQGNITQSVISSRQFTSTVAYTPNMRMTSSGIAGIVFRGTSNRGYLTTIGINSSGIIGASALSTLVFDTSSGYEPHLRNIAGTAFTLFYRGAGNDGMIKSITIAANGIIDSVPISSFIFNATYGAEPYFIYLSGNTYAAVYRGGASPNNNPYVITVQIETDSTITYQIQAVAVGTTVTAEVTINSGIVQIQSWNITR